MYAHVYQWCQTTTSMNGTACYSSETLFPSFSSHVPHFTTARSPATCSPAWGDSRPQASRSSPWSPTFVSTPHRTSLLHRFSHFRVISPRRSQIFLVGEATVLLAATCDLGNFGQSVSDGARRRASSRSKHSWGFSTSTLIIPA